MLQVRRALSIQLGGLAIAVGLVWWLARSFPLVEWIAAVQQQVMSLGSWSALWYPVLYACCNLLLLPGGILSLGGGFFFGLWWGFAIVLAGNLLGASAAFFISRKLGRQWIKRRLARHSKLAALDPAIAREGWKVVLLSQLHPLFPTSLLNYVYGLTKIRFRTCLFWVAVGQAPGLFLYAYVGTLGQLGLRFLRGKTHPRVIEFWLWGGGLATTVIFLVMLSRIAVRLLKEVEEKTMPPSDPKPSSKKLPVLSLTEAGQ